MPIERIARLSNTSVATTRTLSALTRADCAERSSRRNGGYRLGQAFQGHGNLGGHYRHVLSAMRSRYVENDGVFHYHIATLPPTDDEYDRHFAYCGRIEIGGTIRSARHGVLCFECSGEPEETLLAPDADVASLIAHAERRAARETARENGAPTLTLVK